MLITVRQVGDRKIHFIKFLRAANAALGGSFLGLKEAKHLADLERPITFNVEQHNADLFRGWVNAATDIVLDNSAESITWDDVGYFRSASYALPSADDIDPEDRGYRPAYEEARHERIHEVLSRLAEGEDADLPLKSSDDDLPF